MLSEAFNCRSLLISTCTQLFLYNLITFDIIFIIFTHFSRIEVIYLQISWCWLYFLFIAMVTIADENAVQ